MKSRAAVAFEAKKLPADAPLPAQQPPAWLLLPHLPVPRFVGHALFHSENGGDSWNRQAKGLPKKESFFTVLRDAMDIDDLKSPALYFGTTTGQLWMGRDGGEEWNCLFDSLPPIHCVKVAVV